MTPFIGQLALFAFNFVPKNWAPCNGQLLAINSNQALFSLLGTTYGGDGRTTFGVPNLQGRVGIGSSSTYFLGQVGGEEVHTLTVQEVPVHNHLLQADAAPASGRPGGAMLAQGTQNVYAQNAQGNAPMAGGTIGPAGSGQPHENRSPYLAMVWCIALTGIFPSRN